MECRIALVAFAALLCGCATEHYVTDSRHPEVSITEAGGLMYRGEFVEPEDLPGLLKDAGYQRRTTINIHVPDDMHDMRIPMRVMSILSRNGFTRSILVGDRKAYAEVGPTSEERRSQQLHQPSSVQIDSPPARRPIRYK